MATISADSELMTNYVAALPVPAGSKFSAVLDENRRAMVLSLSNDAIPKLQFIRNGLDGVPILVDMSTLLGIPSGSIIETFCIRQTNELYLYLAVSYQNGSNTSTLKITEPFLPQSLQGNVPLSLVPGDASIGQTNMLYMTPVNILQQDGYPSIYAVHKTLDQTVSWGDDITEVIITYSGWKPSQRMSTPENVSEVLDIAPACNIYGNGIFVLYKSGGQSKLYARFLAPDPNQPGGTVTFVTSVACPTDATCIESYWDPRNRSALLIGSSEGIRMLSPSESVSKSAKGIVITSDPVTKNIQDLVVAQDNKQLSLWFRNQPGDLCYLRTLSDHLTQGVVSKLLPNGKASSFAACIAQPSEGTGQIPWQMLVSNDENGNLTLLQQALDSGGIWRPSPFYTPSNTDNVAIQSYTVTLKSSDAKGNPIKNGQMFVSASSSVDIIENGRHNVLPEAGRWFDIDTSGTVHLIVPTDTLASQTLKITQVRDNSGKTYSVDALSFNPAKKAMDTLNQKAANINSPADLKNVRTSSGNTVFGQNLSSDDANAGIQALKNLQTAYKDLPADGSIAGAKAHSLRSAVRAPTVRSISDKFWDGWHWIKEHVESAWDWVVKKVGDAWHFVCKIAGEIQDFVLDCLEKVGEAFSWVFEKIKAGWDKLVEWVGFIFSWGDILETKDTISSIISAGIELGEMKVGDVTNTIDGFFVNLLNDVDSLMVTSNGGKSLSGSSGSSYNGSQTVQDTTSSTKFNWAGERLKNGGAGTSTQIVTNTTGDPDTIKTWGDVFQPALDGMKEAIQQVGDDIANLFTKQGSMTTDDFMKLSKDVIKLGIQTIRGLVSSLMRLVIMLLKKIGEYGNKAINMPIYSALYKLIAKHDLTVFDAVSLILAIPTTIFMKIITGNKPPTLPDLNGKLLGQIVLGPSSDGQVASPQMILDFNVLTGGIVVSGVLVKTIVNLLKFAYGAITGGVEDASAVFKGPGGFLEALSVIIDMVGTLHAMPSDPTLPGLEYRKWVARICLIRGATHLLHLFAGGGETAKKALLVFDMISALVNFGLQQATSVAEGKAGGTWKDYDDETTIVGSVSSGLNAIAAVGYFAAFMAGVEEPEVSAVGLVILEAGTIGLAVTQGINYKIACDKKKKALLLPPSA